MKTPIIGGPFDGGFTTINVRDMESNQAIDHEGFTYYLHFQKNGKGPALICHTVSKSF